MARTSRSAGKSATACSASRASTGTDVVLSNPTRSLLAPMSTVPAGVPSTTAEVSSPAESLATFVT